MMLCPRLEEFAECFPGKISFSDVDGWVEINGKFLVLEWKSAGGKLREAQRIAFKEVTKSRNWSVFVVHGNPRLMTVDNIQIFRNGKSLPLEYCDLETLKLRFKKWAKWAKEARK